LSKRQLFLFVQNVHQSYVIKCDSYLFVSSRYSVIYTIVKWVSFPTLSGFIVHFRKREENKYPNPNSENRTLPLTTLGDIRRVWVWVRRWVTVWDEKNIHTNTLTPSSIYWYHCYDTTNCGYRWKTNGRTLHLLY
jgi:hypothetical protein